MKTFEEFKAALKNGEFKTELEEFAKSAKDKAEHEIDVLFCEFAKKLGYDMSVEDLAAQKAAAQEMSDDEVEAVAGGICVGPTVVCGEPVCNIKHTMPYIP